MASTDRRELILALVTELGYASVESLAERADVSAATIRRDLDRLTGEGLLSRTHGGAAASSRGREHPFGARTSVALPQKRAIGRAAADLVRDGEVVMIDGGTTMLEVVRQLVGRSSLEIVTHSLRALQATVDAPRIKVFSPGGTLKHQELALVGPTTEAAIRTRRAAIAFIGASGFIPGDGATDHDELEVAVKQAMMSSSARQYLVADSRKLGVARPVLIAPLTAFTGIVTDDGIPPDVCRELRDEGLEVVVATPTTQLLVGRMDRVDEPVPGADALNGVRTATGPQSPESH